MSELSSKERNALPDSQFGLPKERKFPLNDPTHVSNAAARIEHAPKAQQKALAKTILAKAHKYGMDTSDWDKTKQIAQEEVDTLTDPAPKNQTTNVNSVGGFTETDLERQVYLNSIDTANSFRSVTSSVETADEQITVNDANRIAALIRSQVLRDSKPPTGNQNCQLCTWCAEAQFRGINVLPRPIYSPRDPALEIVGEGIVKNPQQNSIRDKNDVINQVTNAGDGARFYCHVNWNGGAGGHEFLLLNLEGSVYLMDAQQGFVSMISGTGAKSYFDNINYQKSYIARLDDHELNEELLREYNDPSKTIMWDPALDIPYMKENGLLSSLETEYTMRNATMADLEFVYQSELETVGENKDDPKVQKYIRDDARDSIGHTKIIVVNGEDVGVYQAYATDYYGMRGGDEDWWYLAHIYIKPEYRSFGIGSAIIKKDISEHDKILLQVMKSNTRAKKLYESLGFVVDRENNHGGIVMRIDKTKAAPKPEPVQEYNSGAALMTVQNQLRNILGNSYTFMGSGTIPKFNVKSNAKPSISFDITVVNGTNAECTPLMNGIPDILHKKRGIALMRAANVLADFIKSFVASNSNGSVQESANIIESGHFDKYKDDVLGFNDEGMAVMKKCECGGKISIAMKGEPIYTCESCGKTYGCVPFQEGVVGKVIVGGIAIVALINLAIAVKDAIKEKRYEKNTPTDGKLLSSIEKFLTYYSELEYKDFLTDTGIRYEYIHDTMEDLDGHLKTIIKYTTECINTTSNCYKSNETMFKEFFTECKTTRSALWDIVCKLDDHVKDYDVDEHCIDKTAMSYRKHYKTLLDQLMKHIEKFLKTLQKTIDSKNVVQEGKFQESSMPDDFWENNDEDDMFTTKLTNEILFEMSKLYYYWACIPESSWQTKSVEDFDVGDDNNWDLSISAPEVWKDLLRETMINTKDIIWIIEDFDKMSDDRKKIHEGSFTFNHEELINVLKDIRDTAKNVYETNPLLKVKNLPYKIKTSDDKKSIDDIRSVGILVMSVLKDWTSRNVPANLKRIYQHGPYRELFTESFVNASKNVVQEGATMDFKDDELLSVLKNSKYGVAYHDKLITNPSEQDYMNKWHCLSPNEFINAGGGVCYDFVEWESDYLKKHQIPFKKFHISHHIGFDKADVGKDAATHSICVAIVNGKYMYIEGSSKKLAKAMGYIKEFNNIDELLDFAVKHTIHDPEQSKLIIIDYTNVDNLIGLNLFDYQNRIFSNGKVIKSDFIQEGVFQDIKNGVNPYSDNLVFHVSMDKHIDGQVWQPRVPDYLDPYNPEDTGFEDNTTPRICFSTSIEGALNGITVNLQRQSPDTFDKMYVYVPEKPWKEYKHKTNKQLVKDKLVYDANVTREVWIMEPVRMKLYGVIRVDQIADAKRKSVVPTSKGQKDTRNYFTYKWHWVVKPKVLKKATKFDYSVETVLSSLCIDIKKFKYGLIKDGRLMTGNVSDADYDKYWVFHSGEMVDQAGGGNCYDMVEYEAGYLEAFGVAYKKYFINATNLENQTLGTHTICVVPHNGKFIYIEQAFKRVVDEWGYERKKEFDKLNDVFEYVAECMSDYHGQPIDFGVWDYTTADIDYGTPIKNFHEWIITKCKMIYDGEAKNPTVKKEDK